MAIVKFESELEVLHINDLDLEDQVICKAATKAMKNAYAIYSNFQVGSALLLDNGEIVTGSNQENAVYPLTLCAERVAIFAASHQYPNASILKLAVATSHEEKGEEIPVFPCGSCRQVINEQEDRRSNSIEVFIVGSDEKVYKMASIKAILPFAFKKSDLK